MRNKPEDISQQINTDNKNNKSNPVSNSEKDITKALLLLLSKEVSDISDEDKKIFLLKNLEFNYIGINIITTQKLLNEYHLKSLHIWN